MAAIQPESNSNLIRGITLPCSEYVILAVLQLVMASPIISQTLAAHDPGSPITVVRYTLLF